MDDRVINRFVREGAFLAPAADGDIDDGRVRLSQIRLVEPEPGHDAGTKVLQEHVRRPRQAQYRVAPGGALRIDGQRAFVAVVVDEGGGEMSRPVSRPTRMVARERRLDLDHVRPLVGEDHGRVGPRDHRREVDDADAVERPGHDDESP